jgi:hypothetical protein
MASGLDFPLRVRFRTEKSLFSGIFAAKFPVRGAANQTLPESNKKRTFGLVC